MVQYFLCHSWLYWEEQIIMMWRCYESWLQSLHRKLSLHFYGSTAPSRPKPLYCGGFIITLGHTKFGRTHLDDWRDRCVDLYLTINQRSRHTKFHAGVRTSNPSKRVASVPRLRPRGRDRHGVHLLVINFKNDCNGTEKQWDSSHFQQE